MEVKGLRGADLDAMRSYHVDAAIEGAIGKAVTWRCRRFYNRVDRDYFGLPDSEFRLRQQARNSDLLESLSQRAQWRLERRRVTAAAAESQRAVWMGSV